MINFRVKKIEYIPKDSLFSFTKNCSLIFGEKKINFFDFFVRKFQLLYKLSKLCQSWQGAWVRKCGFTNIPVKKGKKKNEKKKKHNIDHIIDSF